MDSSQIVIGTNVQQLSQAVKARMSSLETVRRGIRRTRQGNVPVSPQPVDRTFVIPAPYITMENGDRFLRFANNVFLLDFFV